VPSGSVSPRAGAGPPQRALADWRGLPVALSGSQDCGGWWLAVRVEPGGHRILVMRGHLAAGDHDGMDPAPVLYMIRIKGHLGATVLSAFPAMASYHHGGHTVLTGLLDRPTLYGVLGEIEALGLDLLEVRQFTPDRKSPGSDDCCSP
jgi:hypothetical protein